MSDLIIFILTLIITYFTGTKLIERRHYNSIKKREREFLNLPAVTSKEIIEDRPIKEVRLVYGSVVVSIDYFKRFLAGLRNIVGGEVSSYETVLDRARREAILRMKESAKGADIIINTRVETSTIGKTKKGGTGCSEILAYGTAITFQDSSRKKETSQYIQKDEERTTPKEKINLLQLILAVEIVIFSSFFTLLFR